MSIRLCDLPAPPENRTGWPWDVESKPVTDDIEGVWPKISIVTPSYNQGGFIEETIRSILLQGYPNLEYIVIDGGSNDQTIQILEKYSPWISYWRSEPDDGQAEAVNFGWDRCTGEIIGWANSDDIYLPGAFELVAREYRHQPFGVFAGATQFIDVRGRVTGSKVGSFAPADLIGGTKPGEIATFYSGEAIKAVGPLRTDLYYCFDREYVMRLSERYFPNEARTCDTEIASFRVWTGTKTSTGRSEAVAERKQIAFEYIDRVIPIEQRQASRRSAVLKLLTDQVARERANGNRLAVIRYSFMIAVAGQKSPGLKSVMRFARFLFFKSGQSRG